MRLSTMRLGILGAAARICDDVGLLWSIADVYTTTNPRPRARELLAGVLYALDKDAAPQRRRAPPQPMTYVEEDDDEALFASAPSKTYDTPAPSNWQRTLADWAARAGDELALFPAYQRVVWRTAARCSLGHGGVGPYGLARACRIAIRDEHWLSAGVRAAVAHPFERAAVALLQGRARPAAPYSGWRAAVALALVERRVAVLGPLAASMRLAWLCSGIDDGAPFRGRALLDAAAQALMASLVEMPRAIACVCAARLVRRALFGGAPVRRRRDRRFRRRLQRALTRSRPRPSRPLARTRTFGAG